MTAARCAHCGGPIVSGDHQVNVEAALAALGVPTIGAAAEEEALARAERVLFGDL